MSCDVDLGKGRVWVVGEGRVAAVLREDSEVVLVGAGEGGREEVTSKLPQLLEHVSRWVGSEESPCLSCPTYPQSRGQCVCSGCSG